MALDRVEEGVSKHPCLAVASFPGLPQGSLRGQRTSAQYSAVHGAMGEAEYRRNSRQLIRTSETPEALLPECEPEIATPTTRTDPQSSLSTDGPDNQVIPQEASSGLPLRQSGRTRKPPDWITHVPV